MGPYTYICSEVANFNYLFGVIDYSYPNYDGVNINKFNSFSDEFNITQVKLRFNLINEEIKELIQAINDKNPIEIIDALCDILYVVAGAKVYFNLPITNDITNNIIEIPNLVNNKDLDNFKLRTIIESLDNELFSSVINNFINSNNIVLNNLTDILINEKGTEYHIRFIEHLITLYNKCLDDIVIGIFKVESIFGIDIIKLFDIVHKSNMSKICNNEEDAIDSVEWYKNNELRYRTPAYREIIYNNVKYYIIYDIETKKILKSIKYTPAKFI